MPGHSNRCRDVLLTGGERRQAISRAPPPEVTLMLNYELLPARKVRIVEPQAALAAADFERLVQAVAGTGVTASGSAGSNQVLFYCKTALSTNW